MRPGSAVPIASPRGPRHAALVTVRTVADADHGQVGRRCTRRSARAPSAGPDRRAGHGRASRRSRAPGGRGGEHVVVPSRHPVLLGRRRSPRFRHVGCRPARARMSPVPHELSAASPQLGGLVLPDGGERAATNAQSTLAGTIDDGTVPATIPGAAIALRSPATPLLDAALVRRGPPGRRSPVSRRRRGSGGRPRPAR